MIPTIHATESQRPALQVSQLLDLLDELLDRLNEIHGIDMATLTAGDQFKYKLEDTYERFKRGDTR